MKRKWLSILVMVMLVSMFLAACGNSSNTGSSGAEGDPSASSGSSNSDKVTIRLATWAGEGEAKELQEILDRLNEQSDTYEIVQESNPSEYDTRIITQLSGDSGPDLVWLNAQRAAQFAAQGILLDITDYLTDSDHPAAQTDDYYEASLQPFTKDERLYGLPWIQQPVMLYVNKAKFDEAGLSYPDESWTWDEFMAAAERLTIDANGIHAGEEGFDESQVHQWGFTLNGWPPVQMFIWQNGGEVILEDFSESPIDTPEAVEAVKFYADLIQSPVTPSQQIIRDRGFDQMFRDGQVAMFMGGAADNLDSTIDHVEAFMVPAGPDGIKATFADVLGMAVNVKTKHPEEAVQALLDLTDAIHHWKIMPPRQSLSDLSTLQEMHPEKAHSLDAIIASMEFAKPYRYFENYPEWDNVFWTQLMDPIINGGEDPETLIPNVKPLLDETLQP